MNCEDFKNRIIDYIDGFLDEEQAEKLEHHSEACNTCKEELEETRQLLDYMSNQKDSQPSAKIKTAFYKMLEKEKDNSIGITRLDAEVVELRKEHTNDANFDRNKSLNFYRVAAAVAILITGFLTGYMFNPNKSAKNNQMADLKSEVYEMKTMFFAQLNEESPSERIEAVEKLEQFSKPDSLVTISLINTMNKDENINVRTAAANALSKYSHDDDVKMALINALNHQKDPLMQITLINILVELDDERAIQPMSQLVFEDSTMDVVKNLAQNGIATIAK